METDLLIPGQHMTVANDFIEYAKGMFEGDPVIKKAAMEIVRAKYFEAYECNDVSRQEYWRVVMNCIDVINV